MGKFQCPYCGQLISDSTSQCENQNVSTSQHKRSGRHALTAMWICIIGTLFSMLSAPYSNIYLYYKASSMTVENYSLWFEGHVIESTIFGLMGSLSAILLALSWILWIRGNKRNAATIIGIVLCVLKMCTIALLVIPCGLWIVIFHLNGTTFTNVTSIVNHLLSIALGITVFFIENTGKVKNLANIAGVLFLVCYAYSLVMIISNISLRFYYYTSPVPVKIFDCLQYWGLLIISIVLFYKTYRQTRAQQQVSTN